MTTAEIKIQALESFQEEMRGASTISLIKMARRLYDQGKEYDDHGDLEAALSAYMKATSLVNEADRDESVVKNFEDIKPMLDDLLSRTKLVEDTLKTTEVQTLREAGSAGFKAGIRPLLLPSMVPGLGGPPFRSQLPPVPPNTNRLVKTMANMTTAEIKSHALESVQRGPRGAPAINLIRTARRLYDRGKEYDDRGDLKAALSVYVKATCLINKADRDDSVVHEEFDDIELMLNDLLSRTELIEDKLEATEVQASRTRLLSFPDTYTTSRDSRREAGGASFKVGIRPLLLPSGAPYGSRFPPLPPVVPSGTNGFVETTVSMTIAEIKSHALESVQREWRGTTTINLIRTARSLYDQGREHDTRSDFKAALSTYVKAACLIKGATESTKMQAEKSSSGVVHKEFNDFRPTLNDLMSRKKIVEEKLKAAEVQASRDSRREAGGAGFKAGIRPLLLPSSAPYGSRLPPLPPVVPSGTNGFVETTVNMTIAEIKSHALEFVQEEWREATTINLIGMARKLYDQGREHDARSDFKAALSAYVKAACLIKGATKSTEMQAEKSSGVVHKEFNDFRPTLLDLISRIKIVEEKLKAAEVQVPHPSDGPIHKYGRSLADQLQALRDNSVAVNTTSKRLSLQHSSPVQSPSSPSRAGRPSQPPPNSLMSTSSFGRPSPSLSSSSRHNISKISQTFPPIDEWEKTQAF